MGLRNRSDKYAPCWLPNVRVSVDVIQHHTYRATKISPLNRPALQKRHLYSCWHDASNWKQGQLWLFVYNKDCFISVKPSQRLVKAIFSCVISFQGIVTRNPLSNPWDQYPGTITHSVAWLLEFVPPSVSHHHQLTSVCTCNYLSSWAACPARAPEAGWQQPGNCWVGISSWSNKEMIYAALMKHSLDLCKPEVIQTVSGEALWMVVTKVLH